MNGKGNLYDSLGSIAKLIDLDVLKQPLRTSVAIDALDFEDFAVEENLHIGINVKDFKAIIIHADTLRTSIRAFYSYPTKPLLLSYYGHGMECNFTLATIGEYRGTSITPAPRTVHATSDTTLEQRTLSKANITDRAK